MFSPFYGSKLYTLIIHCMKMYLILSMLEKIFFFFVNVFAKLEEVKAACISELLKGWEGWRECLI